MFDWLFGNQALKANISYIEAENKLHDEEERSGRYRFKNGGGFKASPWKTRHLPISWYRCPKCNVQWNTSPPSYNMLSMERTCPDCSHPTKDDK